MDVCVLGSGSKGNCTYIASGDTAILIDAGLSRKQILTRMMLAGIDPRNVKAIFFTHAHTDHCAAAATLSSILEAEIFANEEVADAIDRALPKATLEWSIFETGQSFKFGDLTIESFPVPHDKAALGYVFDDGTSRLFYATDLGSATEPVKSNLKTCDAAILESNHDLEMLRLSPRDERLKQRIAGRNGHLSNDDACRLVCECASERLRLLLLAHLSEDCNSYKLARTQMQEALRKKNRTSIQVETLPQHEPSAFFSF